MASARQNHRTGIIPECLPTQQNFTEFPREPDEQQLQRPKVDSVPGLRLTWQPQQAGAESPDSDKEQRHH